MTTLKITVFVRRDRPVPTGYSRAAEREYRAYARIYVHPAGETILENLVERRNRPTALYRELMPEILRRAGLPADTKVTWSQHAGCSMCPCSPGFIVKDHSRFDVWVDVAPETTTVGAC